MIHFRRSLPVMALLFKVTLLNAEILPLESNSSQSMLEAQISKKGLIDIQKVDSTIKVELKYASSSNFMGASVYGNLRKCYLQRSAADKLALANSALKKHHPDLTLLVVDGLRPRHIQKKMYEVVMGTPMENYIANPQWGSMHNYGCAVDVTICDSYGNHLDMGTPMDYFGVLSEPRQEARFLKEGKLTSEQVANRKILRKAMVAAGFIPLAIEWWHFEAFDKETIRATFSIIE